VRTRASRSQSLVCITCVMRPIATDDPVAWCIGLSFSLTRSLTVQTRLNRSRYCFGWRLGKLGAKGTFY